jgi:hypothetical protein
MKNHLKLFLFLPGFLFFIANPIPAQNNSAPMQQDREYKVKIKGDKTIVQDKSKPVRRALEIQYAKLAEANKNKDLNAILALRVSDFSVKMPSGETWNYERSAAYSKAAFEQVQQTLNLTYTIDTIDLNDNEATAIIHQQWTRMQIKGGQLRRVETTAVQRETWVNTADGWKLKLIDEIHPGIWIVDGKRVDPSKPYDPNAAPYHPVEPKNKE